MRFIPTGRAASLPLIGRLLLLSVSLFLFLILNTIGTGEVAQSADDHGNYLNNATNLSLGSSVAGRIDPGDDQDIFRLNLTGRSSVTNVWIYTTGTLDTAGGLYDSNGKLIVSNDDPSGSDDTNFRIPYSLSSGIYYIGVFSADKTTTGNYTLHVQADDHSHYLGTVSTPLPLGSSIAGRIDPGYDWDIFELDLSSRAGATDVWIYTTGDLDTAGGLHYSSGGRSFLWNDDSYISGNLYNFHLRATLSPDIYYVRVYSSDRTTTGNYTLHAQAVTDPGNIAATATRLNLGTLTAGSIDTASDVDYFRVDLTSNTNLFLQGIGLILYDGSKYLPFEPIRGEVLDSAYNAIPVNVYAGSISFIIRDDFSPGTYYVRVTTPSGVDNHPVPYTIQALDDTDYTNFINDCESVSRPSQISDSLYGCQWHLSNSDGEDIDVEPVWAFGIDGTGINIAIVDDGMDWSHEDLVDNVNTALNHDYYGRGNIHHPFQHHGTNVAGVVAARDNGIGVRGVAPRATIYGYNLIAEETSTAFDTADAMARNRVVTAVSNNSWGPKGGPGLGQVGSFWESAVKSGIDSGYGGKGVFYVFAGGNGHLEGDDSNLSELSNFYAVTSVCAVNDGDTRSSYSEKGANLWVCAPSNGYDEHRGIVTVENSDRYIYNFGGTSSAAPTVSGVVALMRQANPNLTWRDLKLILAESARKNDPTNTGWENGARKYGSSSASNLYHFNHEYGFGTVDAKAAVDLAKAWSGSLPTLKDATASSGRLNVRIPDAPLTGAPTTVTRSLTLNTDIDFTEFVEINVTFDHSSFRDLDIDLVSPSGAVSHLTVPFDTFNDDDPDNDYFPLKGTFRLGSARHLGEDPNGVWQLRVTDRINVMNGTLTSWDIKVYGHSSAPADTVTVTTASANALVRIDSPIAVTATFSKPVSGFTVDDVSVANGTASNFVGSDGSSVYTFDVTPNAIGAVTVDIAAGAAQDSDGNIAAAQLSLGIPYDDDGDGTINQTEVLTAVADYFRGALSALQVLAVVSLYFTSG